MGFINQLMEDPEKRVQVTNTPTADRTADILRTSYTPATFLNARDNINMVSEETWRRTLANQRGE